MLPENFTLTWQSHTAHSSTLLTNLLRSQELTDLTIISADMKEVRAHKVVLGSVSRVLNKLFSGKSENNFCLYIAGVKTDTVMAMLNFIYVGEATVSQADFDSFFKIAKEFEIEGLANYSIVPENTKETVDKESKINSEYKEEISNEEADNSAPSTIFPCVLCDFEGENETDVQNHKIAHHSEIKQTVVSKSNNKVIEMTKNVNYAKEFGDMKGQSETNLKSQLNNTSDTSESVSNKEEKKGRFNFEAHNIDESKIYKRKVKNHEIEKIKPVLDDCGIISYPCNQCSYESSKKGTLKNHLDFIHRELKVICDECNKIYGSLSALRRHTAIEHRGKISDCDMCDFKSKSSSTLKYHRLRHHELLVF